MDPLISAREIAFAYDHGPNVIDGFTFELKEGDRVILTGPNGSGKTTFLLILLGFLHPSAGEVHVFGKPRITEADFQQVRREVGMVFQDSQDQVFCPTVYEDVAFGPLNLGLHGEELKTRVLETLDRLKLAALRDTATHRLSHGQRRLVALAGVLAMEPRVLLLDEPTAGLDQQAEQRLLEVLLELPQEMIVVSHNEPFMQRLETRRVVMGD